MEQTIKVFKALSDASRLKILVSLLDAPKYVELIAERSDLSASTVSFHLKKLEEAGLVTKEKDQYYIVYSIVEPMLDKNLRSLISVDEITTDNETHREEAYKQKILQTFFEFGKLKSIPVQRKKRLVILEKLVESFAHGQSYSEKEVNLILAQFNEDFATLRRELINEKLMSRDNNIYVRR